MAVVNYGLMPAVPLRDIVAQVRRCCAWLFENADPLGVDARRIVCSGHSAGGQLTAMMLASDWPRIAGHLPGKLLAGGVALSGLFDLEPLTRAPFLRDDLKLDAGGARELSPAFLTQCNEAPLIRVVGALESEEFHRQSQLMADAWKSACAAELIRVPGCDHLTVCESFAAAHAPHFQAARALLA